MPFWGWIVVGAALLGAETIVSAQFYLVFLGAAALATGLVVAVAGPFAPAVDWAIYGVLAVASTAAFRRRVYERIYSAPGEVSQGTVGEFAVALEAIAADGRGQVELRGTVWQAHNRDNAPLAAGERARVVATHGLVLELRRES
jgi:membrane protein implicated in regulation of membrane protease activity